MENKLPLQYEGYCPNRKRPTNFELLGYNLVPGKPYLTTEDRLRALSRTRYYANGTFNKGYYEGLVAHELDDDDRALLESEMRDWFISDRNEKFHDFKEEENKKKSEEWGKKQQERIAKEKKEREERIQRLKEQELGKIGFISPVVYEPTIMPAVEVKNDLKKARKELDETEKKLTMKKEEIKETKGYKPEQMRKIRKELKDGGANVFKKIGAGMKKLFIDLFCEEVEGNYEK